MLLRKPYAFLVKHFKLIHFILALVIAFLVYRTNVILNFLNQYIGSNQLTIGNVTGTLFTIWMYVIPFIIIIISLIIIKLMYEKKKPILFYLYNIVLALSIIVIYIAAYFVMKEMEMALLETRVVRLLRDLITLLELFQTVSLITALIRATGFDIKKFNFGKDLKELDINEDDNEKFEISLEVDTNHIHRKFKRFWRMVKYRYYEHRFIIDIGLCLLIGIVCTLIYMNVGIYNRAVKQNTYFGTSSFNLGITNSYLTTQNYKGNIINKDYAFVILELSIKNKGTEKALDTNLAHIEIDNKYYFPTLEYNGEFIDLGNIYQNSNISNSFEKYILVFKIPTALQKKKITFHYTDQRDTSKHVRVNIKSLLLDQSELELEKNIKEDLSLENSILKNTILNIQTVDIQKEFKESYNFCITKEECYPSVEYIMPNYNGTEEKAILKINGTLNLDKDIEIKGVANLYQFISSFGKIEYEKKGKVITSSLAITGITPSKFTIKNTYYVEVPSDIFNADKIWLRFHIRNKEYLYQIQ